MKISRKFVDILLVTLFLYLAIGIGLNIIRYMNHGSYFFDNGYHINRIGRILSADNSTEILFEGHFQPILLIHAALFAVFGDFPGPAELLLIIQTLTLLAGICMTWIFTGMYMQDPLHRKIYLAVLLLSPPFWFALLGDYHVETALYALVPLSFILLRQGRQAWFVATLFIYCALKEVYPFISAGFCLTACLYFRNSRRLQLSYLMLFFVFIIIAWLEIDVLNIPLINQYEPSTIPMHSDFRHLGDSVSDVFGNIFKLPFIFLEHFTAAKMLYLFKVFFPWLLLTPFCSPFIIPAVPGLCLALFSSNPHHYSYAYQYAACVFPFVFCAYCDETSSWKRNRIALPAWSLAATCMLHLAFSPAPLGRVFWVVKDSPFHRSAYRPASDSESLRQFIDAAESLPEDALYYVQNSFYLPQIVRNRETLVFSGNDVGPLECRSIYILLCENRPRYMLDAVDGYLYSRKLEALKTTTRTLYSRGGLHIFHLQPKHSKGNK